MKLYHTGKVEIRYPDIKYGRKNADFGQGFYLTPDKDFSYRWASQDAVINVYELDIEDLEVHYLSRDREWFDYIYNNRRGNDALSTDIVIGPIANDTIYDTFGIITSGLIKPPDALRLLQLGNEYIQVAVKTEKALEKLSFVGSDVLTDVSIYKEIKQAEQDEYQMLLTEEMNKIF